MRRVWLAQWRAALDEGFLGLGIDELRGGEDAGYYEAVISCLNTIKAEYPYATIVMWQGGMGFTPGFARLLPTFEQTIDFIVPEVYLESHKYPDYATSSDPFPNFRAAFDSWRHASSILGKRVLIGLGTVEEECRNGGHFDTGSVAYADFLAAQVDYCFQRLDGIRGIALWSPAHLKSRTLQRLNEAISRNVTAV
jgi:hypothetical protein